MKEALDAVGGPYDRVKLVLGTDEVLIAEAWDVSESVLATPAAFTLTLGQAQPIAKLFTVDPRIDGSGTNASGGAGGPTYPKGTPFKLYIADALQMTGVVEGFHVTGKESRVTLKGRDNLARLMMSHAESTKSFVDGTYTDLVTYALKAAGFPKPVIASSALANRKVKAGVPIEEIASVVSVDQINQVGTSGAQPPNTTGTLIGAIVHQEHQNNIGENLLRFCRRHLDRVGLFLWAAADGTFILSQPNAQQKPIYRVIRKRGSAEASNVVDVDFLDDATNRHTNVVVFGRGGGRKQGRGRVEGGTADPELLSLGFKQSICYRDVNVQNLEQAEFFARRKLAEEHRNGWNLTYTVRGHRLDGIDGRTPGSLGPIITPDTTVYVEDDELGLKGTYYIESVRRMRSPHTTTQIRLMRLQDLLFGTGGIDG